MAENYLIDDYGNEYEPTVHLKKIWLNTKSQSFSLENIRLPGLIGNHHFKLRIWALIAIIGLEIWGLSNLWRALPLDAGIRAISSNWVVSAIVYISIFFFLDFLFAFLAHLFVGRNKLAYYRKILAQKLQVKFKKTNHIREISSQKRIIIWTQIWKIFWYLAIVAIAAIKVVSFNTYYTASLDNYLAGIKIVMIAVYIGVALLHMWGTGYLIFDLYLRRQINIQQKEVYKYNLDKNAFENQKAQWLKNRPDLKGFNLKKPNIPAVMVINWHIFPVPQADFQIPKDIPPLRVPVKFISLNKEGTKVVGEKQEEIEPKKDNKQVVAEKQAVGSDTQTYKFYSWGIIEDSKLRGILDYQENPVKAMYLGLWLFYYQVIMLEMPPNRVANSTPKIKEIDDGYKYHLLLKE